MSGDGSNQMNHMTLEQKLAIIDTEIRQLHQFCINNGYSPATVEASAKPLIDLVNEAKWRKRIGMIWKLSVIVALISAMIYFDPAYRLVCSYSKIASTKVLPYWDWTKLHDYECFVSNPYFIDNQLTEEDCELCEILEEVSRVSNISHSVMSEAYLKRDIPVIITDAMVDWPAQSKFNFHFIHELYSKDEILKEAIPCEFQNNLKGSQIHFREFMTKVSKGMVPNWYTHWENCDIKSAKVIRQFYKRPYFIPPMIEVGQSNWIFMSSYYKAKRPKPADIALPMVWFAQLKGDTKITLTPRPPCTETCSTLYATIHPGEILVLTDLMWLFDYQPTGNAESVAIAAGGSFD